MTRKRFIKLLMGDGYSRNEANHIARNTKVPYVKKYTDCFVKSVLGYSNYDIALLAAESISAALNSLSCGISEFSEALQRFCSSI